MNRVHTADTAHKHHRGILHITFGAAAAALVVFGAGVNSALAQDNSNPTATRSVSPNPNRGPTPETRLEAPIGHRQPTARDLPADVRKGEGARTQSEQELDDKLRSICRGC
jgi:hypothetical protein